MAMETTAILRSVLYQVKMAESLEDAEMAIKVMCTKDDVAAVNEQVQEAKANKLKKQTQNKANAN